MYLHAAEAGTAQPPSTTDPGHTNAAWDGFQIGTMPDAGPTPDVSMAAGQPQAAAGDGGVGDGGGGSGGEGDQGGGQAGDGADGGEGDAGGGGGGGSEHASSSSKSSIIIQHLIELQKQTAAAQQAKPAVDPHDVQVRHALSSLAGRFPLGSIACGTTRS